MSDPVPIDPAPIDPVLTVGDRDGGVSHRLTRRCRLAASIMLVVGAGLLLVVAVRTWDVISALLTLVAGLAVIGAAIMARRGSGWSAIGASVLPDIGGTGSRRNSAGSNTGASSFSEPHIVWLRAVVGPPRPLSPQRAGAPIKRRLGPVVVPIHAADGPAPGGGALVVHARGDSAALVDGDTVLARRAGRTTGRWISGNGSRIESAATTGHFVLLRESDGEVFLATTRLTDTW